MLTYGSRQAYITGLNDFLHEPMLTMPQEFDRRYSWTDWKGVRYTLRECWAYVNGPARAQEGCTPGHRDQHNDGKTPADFLAAVNALITERRAQGFPPHHKQRELSSALLTLDEVLAVRLYSGPAYQPINNFLRQVGVMGGEFRAELVRHAQLTMAATAGHIVSAIRKLSVIATDEEACRPLYRCVRGELPRSFWLPDDFDMLCATDMGFMSTSRQQLHGYLGPGDDNVLWKIQPSTERDDGYHYGADIAMLSQFAAEDEVLFPPCTMLIVLERPSDADDGVEPIDAEHSKVPSQYGVRRAVHGEEEHATHQRSKTFVSLDAVPCFI